MELIPVRTYVTTLHGQVVTVRVFAPAPNTQPPQNWAYPRGEYRG